MNRVNAFQILKLMKYSQQQFDMKNINLFLLTVGFLICSSLCYQQIGTVFGIVGPLSSPAFKCLRQTVTGPFYGWHFIRAYRNSQSSPGPGVDSNGLTTMTNCFNSVINGYSRPDVYVQICRGINATTQVYEVRDQIITPYMKDQIIMKSNRIFMIKVQQSTNPNCLWSNYTPSSNCEFLLEAYRVIKSFGWTTYIFSTVTSWKDIMGSSCDVFGTLYVPLFYARYNGGLSSTKSYDDFVPFGGWTRKTVLGKLVGKSVRIPLSCPNVFPTSVVVEEYWQCIDC